LDGLPGLRVLTDSSGDIGVDPDVLAAGGNTTNIGWNILKHYYYYDSAEDKMYVGIECAGLCGDADGNGNAITTWPSVPANYDTDWTNEHFQMKINMDGTGGPEFFVGKLEDVNGLAAGWGIWSNNGGVTNMFSFAQTADTSAAPAGVTSTLLASNNDIQFVIGGWSTLTGGATPRQIRQDTGSIVDAGTGEDNASAFSTDLTITKTNGQTTYTVGQTFDYTIVITNNGPNSVVDGVFTDSQVAGQFQINSFTCTGVVGAPTRDCNGSTAGVNAAGGAGNISQIFSLASGQSLTYTVNVTVLAGATGNLVNTASETLGTLNIQDTTNLTDTATDTDTPPAPPTGTVTVTKVVTNDNGGTLAIANFPLLVNGNAVTSGTSNTLNSGVAYTISETQQIGYTQSSISCVDNATAATLANPFTLNASQNVTCTITNDDIAPTLTVTKVVTNDNGGTLTVANFPLFLNGTVVTSGTSNPATAGTVYTVTEIQQTGYTQTSIACVDNATAAVVAHPVTLALDQDVTCTVTNNDISPTITVTKVVTNDNGGTLAIANFPLFLNGTAVTSGTSNPATAGVAYTVTETQQTGYTQTSIACVDNGTAAVLAHPVTLTAGQSATCTITNNDIAPTLTVTKVVTNDNGGTLTVANFPLFLNGTAVTSGTANTATAGVAYTVTETQQTGYAQTSLVCTDNGTAAVLTHPVTLTAGQSATCTITNNDIAPTLTVTKVVTNDNGGTLTIASFPLSVGATLVTSGTANTFSAGTYNITEVGSSDYLATFSGDCSSTGSITLALGEVKTCTITNNDYPNLGDYVWIDTDADGIQEVGETGLNGVTVNLYCSGSAVVLKTTTTINNPVGGLPGYYQFTHLNPAACNYVVEFIQPAPYVFTTLDNPSSDLTDSDADRTTGRTIPITMVVDIDQEFWDTGLFIPATLGDFVWHDQDGDGIQDANETDTLCRTGVTVKLQDAAGNPVLDQAGVAVVNQVTTSSGAYLFTNLRPGVYKVDFDLPAGSPCVYTYLGTGTASTGSDADRTTGTTATTTLISDEDDMTWDAGLFIPATLGDFVWYDRDSDGVQDVTETDSKCRTGVTVSLLDTTGLPVSDASNPAVAVSDIVTGTDGKYLFANLRPGDYKVKFSNPASDGCVITFTGNGTPLTDSDADRTTGETVVTTLISDEDDLSWDAGLILLKIGDYAWYDKDQNCLQGIDELGVEGLTVNLFKVGSTNIFMTMKTDASGKYLFEELKKGDYYVQIVRPDGYAVTTRNCGTDDKINSDIDTSSYLTSNISLVNADDLTWDAGFILGCVGDYVWYDKNGDGIQDASETPLEGVTVTLEDLAAGTKKTMNTNDNGWYMFCDLKGGKYIVTVDENQAVLKSYPPFSNGFYSTTKNPHTLVLENGQIYKDADFGFVGKARVGDQVFIDNNKDCVFNSNDIPVFGVKLTLKSTDGTVLATTTTDAEGFYYFEVTPFLKYTVEVDSSWKSNTALTSKNPTCELTKTSPVLYPGERYLDLDFGFVSIPVANTGADFRFMWIGIAIISIMSSLILVRKYILK